MPKTNVEFEAADKATPASVNWKLFIRKIPLNEPIRVKWADYCSSTFLFRKRLYKACLPLEVSSSVRIDRANRDYVYVWILPKVIEKETFTDLELFVEDTSDSKRDLVGELLFLIRNMDEKIADDLIEMTNILGAECPDAHPVDIADAARWVYVEFRKWKERKNEAES